jgi:hypothetical protein
MGHAILLSRATCVIREEILRQPQVLSLVGRRLLFTSPRNHAVRTVFPVHRETRASGASLKATRKSVCNDARCFEDPFRNFSTVLHDDSFSAHCPFASVCLSHLF